MRPHCGGAITRILGIEADLLASSIVSGTAGGPSAGGKGVTFAAALSAPGTSSSSSGAGGPTLAPVVAVGNETADSQTGASSNCVDAASSCAPHVPLEDVGGRVRGT